MRLLKKLGIIISGAVLLNLSSMTASADANTLNVQVHMTGNQFYVYNMPGAFTRLTYTFNKVRSFYKIVAGININLDFERNNNYIHNTWLETCSKNNYLNMFLGCRHWNDEDCINSTKSTPSGKHHTNAQNIIYQLPNPTSNYAIMLLSPNTYCMQFSSGHSTGLLGKCWPFNNKLAVTDADYAFDDKYSSTTKSGPYDLAACVTIHELGHLYGIKDHNYDEGDETIDNCIWGSNKMENDVYSKLTICNDCLTTLKSNAGKYNHTPIE